MRDDEVVCSVTSSATRNPQSEINVDILPDRLPPASSSVIISSCLNVVLPLSLHHNAVDLLTTKDREQSPLNNARDRQS